MEGMVWVDGKGYVRIAKARVYQAMGFKVRWETAEEETGKIAPLQYKDN